MDVPFADLFCASSTCRGKRFARAEDVVFVGGSFELQLETAAASSNPKAIMVVTSRSGVQNFNFLTSFFRSDIFTSSCQTGTCRGSRAPGRALQRPRLTITHPRDLYKAYSKLRRSCRPLCRSAGR